MRQLDENKLAKLHTADELLNNKYGEMGSESRTKFHEKSIAWYYGEILRDRRNRHLVEMPDVLRDILPVKNPMLGELLKLSFTL